MPATHRLSYVTVEGYGPFPLDMLRYDSAVPDTSDDVAKIADYSPPNPTHDKRRVTLRVYTPTSNRKGSEVTPERWRSFGWKVVHIRYC